MIIVYIDYEVLFLLLMYHFFRLVTLLIYILFLLNQVHYQKALVFDQSILKKIK